MKLGFGIVALTVAAVGLVVLLSKNNSSSDQSKTIVKNDRKVESVQIKTYSINQPDSLWVVVNKGRVLPSDFAPSVLITPNVGLGGDNTPENTQLRADAATAFESLVAAASSDGLNISLTSGYRSYATQSSVYNSYVASIGVVEADKTSAHPGHSEHQTGLAVDIEPSSGKCRLSACFADTPEGKWVVAHAHEHGFVIRYQKDKTTLTGYDYEPWHLRYVGSELAGRLHVSGQTLEEYFKLPFFMTYPDAPFKLY